MGLAQLINDQPDLIVCDEAGDAASALETLKENGANLVLSEIALPDKSGLELIRDIKAMRPGLPVLVISMHDESLYAERALHAGARPARRSARLYYERCNRRATDGCYSPGFER
jgi:DNA-binding NarL/FixJ family response regulator